MRRSGGRSNQSCSRKPYGHNHLGCWGQRTIYTSTNVLIAPVRVSWSYSSLLIPPNIARGNLLVGSALFELCLVGLWPGLLWTRLKSGTDKGENWRWVGLYSGLIHWKLLKLWYRCEGLWLSWGSSWIKSRNEGNYGGQKNSSYLNPSSKCLFAWRSACSRSPPSTFCSTSIPYPPLCKPPKTP